MKTLMIVSLLALPISAFANSSCEPDYKLNLRLAYALGYFDVDNLAVEDAYRKTSNNASRVGGSVLLNCGTTTFKYSYHTAIDFMGDHFIDTDKIISSYSISDQDYGSLEVGKMNTAYKLAGKQGDPFWDTPAGTTFAANSFGFSSMTRGFTDDSFFYYSPKINRLKANLGYTGKNSNGDIHLGLEYSDETDVLGIQYIDLGDKPTVANGSNNKEATRLHYRKKVDDWLLSSSYEYINTYSSGEDEYLNLSVQKPIVNFGRVAAAIGHVSNADFKLINGSRYSGDGQSLTLGAFYNWIKGGELYLLGTYIDLENGRHQKNLALGFNYHLDF